MLLEGFLLLPLGDQLCHHGILSLLVVFGGVLDVDLPAGESGGQTHVLAFAADGQAQLIGGHQHMGVLAHGIHQAHHFHPSGAEGVGDVLARILRPADHVDFFSTQFVHHLLNAGAAGADAGADGIHLAFDAVDGHLGAGAHGTGGGIGLTGHGHDPNGPFLNFGNFVLEQVDHQTGIGAADEQLRSPAGHFAHLFQEDLEGGVGAVVVVGQLIAPGEFSLHFRTAQA